MTSISNSIKIVLTLIIVVIVTACSPLRFHMYVRNVTSDTAFLSLQYESNPGNSTPTGIVRYRDSLLEINDKTINKLGDTLKVTATGDNRMSLNIPPHSTIFLSDLVYSIYGFPRRL